MDDRNNKMILAKNIRHYMEQNNKTRNEMCEALGVIYDLCRLDQRKDISPYRSYSTDRNLFWD